jgi:hypothetical protein
MTETITTKSIELDELDLRLIEIFKAIGSGQVGLYGIDAALGGLASTIGKRVIVKASENGP